MEVLDEVKDCREDLIASPNFLRTSFKYNIIIRINLKVLWDEQSALA